MLKTKNKKRNTRRRKMRGGEKEIRSRVPRKVNDNTLYFERITNLEKILLCIMINKSVRKEIFCYDDDNKDKDYRNISDKIYNTLINCIKDIKFNAIKDIKDYFDKHPLVQPISNEFSNKRIDNLEKILLLLIIDKSFKDQLFNAENENNIYGILISEFNKTNSKYNKNIIRNIYEINYFKDKPPEQLEIIKEASEYSRITILETILFGIMVDWTALGNKIFCSNTYEYKEWEDYPISKRFQSLIKWLSQVGYSENVINSIAVDLNKNEDKTSRTDNQKPGSSLIHAQTLESLTENKANIKDDTLINEFIKTELELEKKEFELEKEKQNRRESEKLVSKLLIENQNLNKKKLSGGTILYHTTNKRAVDAIFSTDPPIMKPGKDGSVGGGIYFTNEPQLTDKKIAGTPRNQIIIEGGATLEARVMLGKTLTIDLSVRATRLKYKYYTYDKLKADGYDSITSLLGYKATKEGLEYIVYNSNQILDLKIYKVWPPGTTDFSIKGGLSSLEKKNEKQNINVVPIPKDLDKQIEKNNIVLENPTVDALCEYAEKNDIFAMQILLNNGIDINSRNRYGNTVLDCAYKYNNKEAIELALNRNANIGGKNRRKKLTKNKRKKKNKKKTKNKK